MFAFAALVVLASACASLSRAPGPQAGRRSSPPLAAVNGHAIDEATLDARAQQHLRQIDDAHAQERLVALWAGIEDAIGDRLLAAEANRRSLDVNALLTAEVHDKVGAVTDAEARVLYDSHRALIEAPFAEAAPILRAQAHADRTRALKRALVDRLRERAQVEVRLPEVVLHRRRVAAVGPTLGPAEAPVTLVIFSDFACPYSAQARRSVRRLHDLYGSALRVVHRNFPLEQHRAAEPMALAGICAAQQGKFWSFYERAFAGEGEPAAVDVAQVARAAGLDPARLSACQLDARTKATLERDIAEGRRIGVRGTPSMFLNGMPLRGVLPLPILQSLVDQERIRSERVASGRIKDRADARDAEPDSGV